ncbi:hypothetical protein [Actinoplanes sp. NPDC020271]|uniref:hypothetical protein n=1 Tax=Actinoplanes sp. NPDC020271 TaxID=3363896 RepID=UPI0037A1DDED
MSADTRLEERTVSEWDGTGEPAFTGLAERHRRDLHKHCYQAYEITAPAMVP